MLKFLLGCHWEWLSGSVLSQKGVGWTAWRSPGSFPDPGKSVDDNGILRTRVALVAVGGCGCCYRILIS